MHIDQDEDEWKSLFHRPYLKEKLALPAPFIYRGAFFPSGFNAFAITCTELPAPFPNNPLYNQALDPKALGAYPASENEPLARIRFKIFSPNLLEKKDKGPARYLRPWVSRLPPGCERMEAWVDIVKQVCRFFRGSSFFFIFFSPGRFHSPIAQAKLFEMCKWSRDDDINELLHLIQAHADAARVVRDRCKTKRWIKKKILEMRSKSGCFYLKAVRSEGGSRGCQF